MAKIYLATSWKNTYYSHVRELMQSWGHEVYDFRDPEAAFQWSNLGEPDVSKWTAQDFVRILSLPECDRGYNRDDSAIYWSNILVMLHPCGNSAHLELGKASGLGKFCIVYYPTPDSYNGPDLMVKTADQFAIGEDQLKESLDVYMNNATLNIMGFQKDEFDSLTKLAGAWEDLRRVPIVDDDYPEFRNYYERALRDFITSLRLNGRIK